MSTVSEMRPRAAAQDDFLPIHGTDYIELYVGNAKQSAHFYRTAFGFTWEGYAGLETGVRDRASYVLQQGKLGPVLTTPLQPDSLIADHIRRHGTASATWPCGSKTPKRRTARRPPAGPGDGTGVF